jgi:hypothetical protein
MQLPNPQLRILGFCQKRRRNPGSRFCRLQAPDKFPAGAGVRTLVLQPGAYEKVERISTDFVWLPALGLYPTRL